MFDSRRREYRASNAIYPELVGRVAISLSTDHEHTGDKSLSLFERVQAAGLSVIEMPDLDVLLSPTEQACMPAAQTMLDVYAKGYQA